MSLLEVSYSFSRSERGLFCEIYFPKRAAYYGAIFDALRKGYDEKEVKGYLKDNIKDILDEFKIVPDLFNPKRYVDSKVKRAPISPSEAIARIDMYQSSFKGWQTYSVDGVWFNEDKKSKDYGKPIEEATQVVRIVFRFRSSLVDQAIAAGSLDVLRASIFWIVSQRIRLDEHKPWSKGEQNHFIAQHSPWPRKKLSFAREHFSTIAKKATEWFDNIVLFTFCYLVRNFWERVVKEKHREDEIWITSFYDLVLNVIKRVEL